MLVHPVLAHRRAFRAMRAEVQRRIEHGLLPGPDAVLDRRVDGTADRAMRADGPLDFDLRSLVRGRLDLADAAVGQLARKRPGPRNEARALQKRPPIHPGHRGSGETAQTWTGCSDVPVLSGQQHDPSPS